MALRGRLRWNIILWVIIPGKTGSAGRPANTEEAILYLNGAEDDSAAGNGAAAVREA